MQYVKSGDITTDIGHAGGVAAVAFSPNGEHLASGGFDRRVCIWNVSDRRLIHTFHGASAALSLAWDPTETGTLVCGFEDGSIYAIHASPVRPSSADYLFYTAHHVNSLSFTPGRSLALTSFQSSILRSTTRSSLPGLTKTLLYGSEAPMVKLVSYFVMRMLTIFVRSLEAPAGLRVASDEL